MNVKQVSRPGRSAPAYQVSTKCRGLQVDNEKFKPLKKVLLGEEEVISEGIKNI